MSISEFLCRVCGREAHGNHFGVFSCRACAAFFRRAANSKYLHKKCQRGGLNLEKCTCKPCRLRKCIEMGMSTEKFQYNRDIIHPIENTQICLTPSMSHFVGRPEFVLFCDPSIPTYSTFNSTVWIDVQHLVTEASRLLDEGCESPIFSENQLKKLTLSFKFVKLDTENLKVFEKMGQTEFLDIIEYYFVTVTKWISHFDQFKKLDKNLQMKLIQIIWHVWSKIHKCVTTAMYRKIHNNVNPTQKIMRNNVLDRERAKLDTSWMSDYPSEYVTKYMFSQNVYDFDITSAIEQLDPSDVELTYMFAQMCFEYAGKRFPGEIQKITDHFQQVLSNDLHEYYVTEQRRPRYFHRLSELMKVNNLIQVGRKVTLFLTKQITEINLGNEILSGVGESVQCAENTVFSSRDVRGFSVQQQCV
ncbi:hypothetical protein GCK72_019978 [Caenorhabditis remanei]|uniref:Nuclear receptor domain-containing protein n=1 Tax=Caenorhabditis remanei TaxID=31234 RepID=A0A6A5GFS5_CAERE|nr:hypothetical protein GCK72_019978 [Caenorhabditis remanei]KAF1753421.1 hypothetical protein GCK72_019978 [Caenorhabditis remanei]